MKQWLVQLPGNRRAWLVSDDPDAALAALGIPAYALTDSRVMHLCENPGYPVLEAPDGPERCEPERRAPSMRLVVTKTKLYKLAQAYFPDTLPRLRDVCLSLDGGSFASLDGPLAFWGLRATLDGWTFFYCSDLGPLDLRRVNLSDADVAQFGISIKVSRPKVRRMTENEALAPSSGPVEPQDTEPEEVASEPSSAPQEPVECPCIVMSLNVPCLGVVIQNTTAAAWIGAELREG